MAVFVAFWMWMMPMITNASGTRVICDEYGVPMPSPANEEEEHKHAVNRHPHGSAGDATEKDAMSDALPPLEPAPYLAPHGEVPHPPPWSVA